MNEEPRLTGTAESLRRSFDRSFSEASSAAGEPSEDFLGIHIGTEAYAVRLAEVVGLHVDRQVVALPSPLPELLGVVGIRGSVRPVYDLPALLGHPPGGAGRWLLLTGRPEVIALACSTFDGHFRLPRREVAHREEADRLHPHLGEVVRAGDGVRPIIDLASLVTTLTQRVRSIAPLKES
jgi:purine-binding chemotaxis protein CheW